MVCSKSIAYIIYNNFEENEVVNFSDLLFCFFFLLVFVITNRNFIAIVENGMS